MKWYFIQLTAVQGLPLASQKSVTDTNAKKTQLSSTNLEFYDFIFWVSLLDAIQESDFDHVYNRQQRLPTSKNQLAKHSSMWSWFLGL